MKDKVIRDNLCKACEYGRQIETCATRISGEYCQFCMTLATEAAQQIDALYQKKFQELTDDRDDWKATAEVAQNPELSRILLGDDSGLLTEDQIQAVGNANEGTDEYELCVAITKAQRDITRKECQELLSACKELYNFVMRCGSQGHIGGDAKCHHCLILEDAKRAIEKQEGL